jgi:hypothetical protein
MFYPDMSHIWNSDTESKYPDPDRTTRLDSIRSGRIGGFTADSLQREQWRRDYYEYVGQQESTFSIYGLLPSDIDAWAAKNGLALRDPSGNDVHQEIPEGSGETPQPSRSSGDPEIQGFPAPQSTIEEIHRLLKPYQRPFSEES